jgi:adenylosuccinate lyase
MGYTHIQPAEPTTVGYRLALYAQDVLLDRAHLHFVRDNLMAKGIRGAVGTSATYSDLLAGGTRTPRQQEEEVLSAFDLRASEVSSQTYPRKLDYLLLSGLAGLGASLSKFALDVRVLSSPAIGEMFEPFGERQVGSSTMPFKRNPILSERIGSLARLLPAYADVAFANAATNMLERTLDDSANRRTILPEALLCTDEIVGLALRVARGLRIDEGRISQNLRTFGPFAGTETVMTMAAKAGANRQEMHELIRRVSMQAWEAIARGEVNPLARNLADDETISQYVDPAEIRSRLDPTKHVGDAAERAENLAKQIVETIATP